MSIRKAVADESRQMPLLVPFFVMTNHYGVNNPDATIAWAPSTSYTVGDIRKISGKHYKAIVNHTSASIFEYEKWLRLKGIPDETNHVILSGQVVNDVDSDFNGESLVDARGLFPRGAGTNATRTKASGSGYAGGNPGEYGDDKFQKFVIPNTGYPGGTFFQSYASGGGKGLSNGDPPTDAGTGEGTPRTGDESSPASFSGWWYMRIK